MNEATKAARGHLRLRFSQLKLQRDQLLRVASAMYGVAGVLAVQTSAPTGGLLIEYDVQKGKTTPFWDRIEAVLVAYGLLLDPGQPAARQADPGLS